MTETILGLDIGSNSVGSAWIDTEKREIYFGVSVFPAGVEESDTNRGAPMNQKRRQARSGRRSTERRAMRKHRLRHVLSEAGLLPRNTDEIREFLKNNPSLLRCESERVKDWWHEFFNMNPWHLRRAALQKELTPYEFGRMLVHLNQRRGAVGFDADADDEGKVKGGIDKVRMQLLNSYGSPEEKARLSTLHDSEDEETRDSFVPEFSAWIRDNADVTFGRMMADELDARSAVYKPIRNRRDSFEFHADRALIRQEFDRVWEKQKSYSGKLAQLLTAQLKKTLDDPDCDSYAANTKDSWRHGGAIFGQRRTYWDTGTLGRCDLEPTEHRCPHADMHAQYYRVIETVNNIRINDRSLNSEERQLVITALRSQKTGSVTTVRRALGINKKAVKHLYRLNLENDSEREINTDWFYREIVLGSIGEDVWQSMSQDQRESVNRAILKFDPTQEVDMGRLLAGAVKWWNLTEDSAKCFVDAWKHRPKIEKRLKLSRTAIRNLLPYMSHFDEENDRWPTQIEARQAFALDMDNSATTLQRERYALSGRLMTKADRHYMKRHPNELPPAPNLANPVVRKAIHEVRRHVNEYLRRFGKPDRVVVELAREARQSEKVRNKQLASNRRREGERKKIEKDLLAWGIRESNWPSAIRRIRLCKEQNGICPFSIEGANRDRGITPKMAAEGRDVEIEHIIPQSRSGPTMNFNNIVLCFRDANRDKADKTPYEWLGPSKLEAVLHRLEKRTFART